MTAERKIPERSQIPVEETWNLADIYPSDEAWREDFDATRALARKLPGYAGRLGESAKTLYEFVELEQQVGEHLNNLGNYAFRKGDQDTRVAENQAMVGKITSQFVALSQAVSFEIPEVLRFPPRPWSGSMGKSRSWSCTAGTFRSSRTAGSTPCPTPRRSCWRAWASWPRPRTTSSPSWPTRT